MRERTPRPQKKKKLKWWHILLIVLLIFAIGGGANTKRSHTRANDVSSVESAQEAPEPTPTPTPTPEVSEAPVAVSHTPAPAPSEPMVWVASSGEGSKYHKSSTCSGMEDPIQMPKSEAEAYGYAPCQKNCCYG